MCIDHRLVMLVVWSVFMTNSIFSSFKQNGSNGVCPCIYFDGVIADLSSVVSEKRQKHDTFQ